MRCHPFNLLRKPFYIYTSEVMPTMAHVITVAAVRALTFGMFCVITFNAVSSTVIKDDSIHI